jgi:hypothetical protein
MNGTRAFPRWTLPALLCGHVVLLLILWRIEGLHTDKEALKYLGCAEQVLHGDLHDLLGNYLPYSTYVLFLLPFVAMGIPTLAIPVQIGLAVFAALALGRMTARISGDGRAGTLATGLFLLCIPVQIWALALYTEYLFTSLAMLLLDQVLARERPGRWTLPLAVLVLFARPVGLLFVGPLLIGSYGSRWSRTASITGYAAVLLVALLTPRVASPQLQIILGSDVLCGCGTDPGATIGFRGQSVLDTQLHLVERNGLGTQALTSLGRIGSLFSMTRPYYSLGHNLLVLPYYLLYPLALLGLWSFKGRGPFGPMAGILVVYALLVGLTCDEWSGRFLVPLLPMVIAPASAFLAGLLPEPRG